MGRECETRKFSESEIALDEIMAWIFKGKWIILGLVVLGTAAAGFFTQATYNPLYKATASMVVNAKERYNSGEEELSQSASDIYLAQKMVNTYSVVLKSNRVMEYVIDDLNLDLTPEELRGLVDLSPVRDTQVLLVSVVAVDPAMAVEIANSLMKVAPQAMMETVERGSLNVLDAAKLPQSTVPARTKMNVAIGAILGLMLGLFIVVLKGALEPKVRVVADIEERLTLRTIGEIPHVKQKESESDHLLFTNEKRDPIFIDAIFYVRTVFDYLFRSKGVGTVLITSALAGEGKTTVAANLALSLAESGKSVLVIDADMRKPSLHRKFGLLKEERNHILNVLEGVVPQEEAIMPVNKNLAILQGSCTEIRKSKRLLGSAAMKMLLEDCQAKYDYVFVDTPPVCAISDAVILSSFADGVLFVIKQDYSRLRDITESVIGMEKAGGKILGCILNDIKKGNRFSGYNSRYYYAGSYGTEKH